MDPTTTHLDPDTLAAYVDGRLAVGEVSRADRHIDECRACRLELSTLAAIHSQPILPHTDAPEGTLGRYHVLRELGRGAMGIVLRAYDPELARPVAIKLVRDVDGGMRELLRREARALARLRHPHVVTIYDVIVESEALYVAMELIEGDTLRGYCRGKSTREILDACVRAGKGLAAAHDAGVIHRDFKPENVLCGEHGEVKVSDFGLARSADDAPDGAWCGTPVYMAPEVLRREPATAASDQYSYCVSVYELLTGERPGSGAAPKASTAFPAIPSWVLRVLRRGLEPDPAARYPSMHVLVAALADDPVVRRRRRMLLAGGAVVALATGALIMQLAPTRHGQSCAIDTTALGGAWTADRKVAVMSAIAAASDADTAQRVTRALDDYAARWVTSRRDLCIAMREGGGEQTTGLVGRRLACLDRNRRELGALATVLTTPERKLASNAQEAVGRLGDPDACAASSDLLPDDAAGRVLGEHGRTVLARANALQYAGKTDASATLSQQLLDQFGPDAEPRLLAQALLVRARSEIDRGNYDLVEELLFQALHAAERGHDDVMVATIWVELVATTGAQKHRFDLAMSHARAADAALARITPSAELRLRHSYASGTFLLAHGKLADARKRLEAGLTVGSTDERRQADVGLIELALCDIARQLGELPVARERCKRGLERVERVLGPNHIRVAVSLSIVGALHYIDHDLAAAERSYQRGIAIFELRGAREHYAYALALSNLASVNVERGAIPPAQVLYARSLAMFDAHHPKHPQRLMPVQGLAGIALRTGNAAAAIPYYRQVRAMRAATYAPEHPAVLGADYNLALALRMNKQHDEATKLLAAISARALAPGKESWILAARAFDLQGSVAAANRDYPAAIALRKQALAALSHVAESVEHAYTRRHLAESHLAMHKPVYAVEHLERVLEFFVTHPGDAYDLGVSRFLLGRALYESKRDRKRAFELLEQARDDLAKAKTGDGLAAYRGNVARYLAGAPR